MIKRNTFPPSDNIKGKEELLTILMELYEIRQATFAFKKKLKSLEFLSLRETL